MWPLSCCHKSCKHCCRWPGWSFDREATGIGKGRGEGAFPILSLRMRAVITSYSHNAILVRLAVQLKLAKDALRRKMMNARCRCLVFRVAVRQNNCHQTLLLLDRLQFRLEGNRSQQQSMRPRRRRFLFFVQTGLPAILNNCFTLVRVDHQPMIIRGKLRLCQCASYDCLRVWQVDVASVSPKDVVVKKATRWLLFHVWAQPHSIVGGEIANATPGHAAAIGIVAQDCVYTANPRFPCCLHLAGLHPGKVS